MILPDINSTVAIPAIASVFSAAIAGYFTFLAARHRPPAPEPHTPPVEHEVVDHQALLNASFNTLVDQLQEERASYLKIIEEQASQIRTHLETIRTLTLSLDEARVMIALRRITPDQEI